MSKSVNFEFRSGSPKKRFSMGKILSRKAGGAFYVVLLCLLVQGGFAQKVQKDARYYDRLMDSIFRDVRNVAQLGMDYALQNEKRIERDFIEWTAGRDMKNPEDDDHFKAVETLHDGWDLLLESAQIFHQVRRRKIDDFVARRALAESDAFRRQGIEKVKEAERLKQAADNRRAARLAREREQAEQQRAAARRKNVNEAKSLGEEFGKINDEEDAENRLYRQRQAATAAEPNTRKRQALLDAENARHRKRMDEIDKKREELGKKMLRNDVSQEWIPPEIVGGDKNAELRDDRREPVGGDRDGDACFIPPPKKFEGCEATMPKEYERWQRESAENDREFKRENARHTRRLQSLVQANKPSAAQQETECHRKRAQQIERESGLLQERHLKCFAKLMNSQKP